MVEIGPYSNYRLTVRLELANKPGIFAKVATLLAEEQANLGAVDLVSATKTRMVRDITFDVQNDGKIVIQRCIDCKTLVQPPRPICPNCHSLDRDWVESSGKGVVYAWVRRRCSAAAVSAAAPDATPSTVLALSAF